MHKDFGVLIRTALCGGSLFLNHAALAAVDIHIEEINAGVLITAFGTINLPNTPVGTTTCGRGQLSGVGFGAIDTSIGSICVGDGRTPANYYNLSFSPVRPSLALGLLCLRIYSQEPYLASKEN